MPHISVTMTLVISLLFQFAEYISPLKHPLLIPTVLLLYIINITLLLYIICNLCTQVANRN